MFGAGDDTFAPWKAALSGFDKRLRFSVVGGLNGKPTVFDDTAYFIACRTQDEAIYLPSLPNSEPAAEFFSAFIFWGRQAVDHRRRPPASKPTRLGP